MDRKLGGKQRTPLAGLNRPSITGPITPRVLQQTVRREAAQATAQQLLQRPRPVVRPAAPPQKVMPKQQSAPPAIARPMRPAQPAPRPVMVVPRPPQLAPRPAQAAPRPVQAVPRPAQAAPRPGQAVPRPPKSAPRPTVAAANMPRPAFQAPAAVSLPPVNVAQSAAAQQYAVELNALQSTIAQLQSRSAFGDIVSAVNNLDAKLNNSIKLLEGAREQGYLYQSDLDEVAYRALDRWPSVRQQVQISLQQQAPAFAARLAPLAPQVQRLNQSMNHPGTMMALLNSTQSLASQLSSDLSQMESSLSNLYDDVSTDANDLSGRLSSIHWALKALGEAKFKLEREEALVMAVQARWDKPGNEDPEGVLYLTNKRLIFERKEEVAVKKILFITFEKELVHEVVIEQPLSGVKTVKAANKGLFGHQDFLEVTFGDAKLGLVPFHLDGQESAQWASWVERARSGEIENERASQSGLSYSDLTGPLTQADLIDVQRDVNELQERVLLKELRGQLAEVENDLRSLERKLADVRGSGYAIEKSLEADITVLNTQWDRIHQNAEHTLGTQVQLLGVQMQAVVSQQSALMGKSHNLAAARPQYMQLKSAMASLEAQAEAAAATIYTQFDEYADEVEALTAHLEWVDWMLNALATATFKLLATESGVAAVEALFLRPGLEPENGILFLTDQRLLWEDRVGDFELKLNMALREVKSVQSEPNEESGLPVLAFALGVGGPYPTVRFQLGLPVADAWLEMVGRAQSGGYAEDRAVALDKAELERIRNAPQQCSNCGASYHAPILRGQTEIICEYCGVSTRF